MSSSSKKVTVAANEWTTVAWGFGFFAAQYTFTGSRDTRYKWRFFAAGAVPYWEGSFTYRGTVTVPAFVYYNIQIKSPKTHPIKVE